MDSQYINRQGFSLTNIDIYEEYQHELAIYTNPDLATIYFISHHQLLNVCGWWLAVVPKKESQI